MLIRDNLPSDVCQCNKWMSKLLGLKAEIRHLNDKYIKLFNSLYCSHLPQILQWDRPGSPVWYPFQSSLPGINFYDERERERERPGPDRERERDQVLTTLWPCQCNVVHHSHLSSPLNLGKPLWCYDMSLNIVFCQSFIFTLITRIHNIVGLLEHES